MRTVACLLHCNTLHFTTYAITVTICDASQLHVNAAEWLELSISLSHDDEYGRHFWGTFSKHVSIRPHKRDSLYF